MIREEIVSAAETWLGTKWVHQASCKGVGTDCIGFIAGVAAECGSPEAALFLGTPEWRRYGRHPVPTFMFKMCDELMNRIPIHQAQFGDVLMFRQEKHPMHFGFLGYDNTLIHAWAVVRKVVKHQLDTQWKSKIIRAYALRGIE